MKWTTANVKNPNYIENHEIYVGTQTGSFKSEFLFAVFKIKSEFNNFFFNLTINRINTCLPGESFPAKKFTKPTGVNKRIPY